VLCQTISFVVLLSRRPKVVVAEGGRFARGCNPVQAEQTQRAQAFFECAFVLETRVSSAGQLCHWIQHPIQAERRRAATRRGWPFEIAHVATACTPKSGNCLRCLIKVVHSFRLALALSDDTREYVHSWCRNFFHISTQSPSNVVGCPRSRKRLALAPAETNMIFHREIGSLPDATLSH